MFLLIHLDASPGLFQVPIFSTFPLYYLRVGIISVTIHAQWSCEKFILANSHSSPMVQLQPSQEYPRYYDKIIT